MRSTVLAGLLYVAACVTTAAQPTEPYLPKSGVISGKVMELVAPTGLVRISEKMQRAVQKDATWFKSYVAKAKEGEPLPYHQRLGVTKAEYDSILHAKMALQENGSVSIKFTTNGQGSLEFAADGAASALTGVKLPAGQKYAETSYGNLTTFSEISQDDPDSATGRWKGVQWKKDESIPSVTLALGRRESGGGIMYYNVTASAGNPGQTLIVFYPIE
jgi:hypothetical protein